MTALEKIKLNKRSMNQSSFFSNRNIINIDGSF